jgi:RimJ/RimL family protein N-acetyltransferase
MHAGHDTPCSGAVNHADREEPGSSGQPVGPVVADWTPPAHPGRSVLEGRYCRLEPLEVVHADALFAAYAEDAEGRGWTYLPYGPFAGPGTFRDWLAVQTAGDDPRFFTVVDPADGRAAGIASYLRIAPQAGSIEVGHIHFAPRLQGTRAATEALVLMMGHAFALGYRRFEWKCDALNAPSRAAARRLGLSYEGVFRQAAVVKGRNRDTAWYAAIDREWPALRDAFARWLDPANFDAHGRQRTRLSDLTRPLLTTFG